MFKFVKQVTSKLNNKPAFLYYNNDSCPLSALKERCAEVVLWRPRCIVAGLQVAETPFARCSYTQGIELLQKAIAEGHKFEDMVGLVRWLKP